MTLLTAFGLFAVAAMVTTHSLYARSHWWRFGFAISCLLGSTYGFLQQAWPFGIAEIIWAIIAFRHWYQAMKAEKHQSAQVP